MRRLRIFSGPQDHEPSCITCLATPNCNSGRRPYPVPRARFGRSCAEMTASARRNSGNAHELRNENVEELIPDLASESGGELDVELVSDGREKGRENEKGRRRE